MESDRDYYLRRETVERRAAEESHDAKARSIHAQLADYYLARAESGWLPSAQITAIQVSE